MANKVRGEVSLALENGRRFTLLMDMEALVEAEAAYGKPLNKTMADAAAGFVGASRALLYGALQARHPEITLRDASAMILSDGEAVTEALSAAVEAAFPSVSDAEGKKGANPPGKTSGRSGAKSAKTMTLSGA